jgi:hypothetical protein
MRNEPNGSNPLPPGHIMCRACNKPYAPMTSDPPTTYISKRVLRQGAVVSAKVPVYACPNCHFKNFMYSPGDVPYVPEPRSR